MGSVSVLDLGSKQSYIIDFTILDTKRDTLLNDGVILMKDANPSTDLEPEYINVANNMLACKKLIVL